VHALDQCDHPFERRTVLGVRQPCSRTAFSPQSWKHVGNGPRLQDPCQVPIFPVFGTSPRRSRSSAVWLACPEPKQRRASRFRSPERRPELRVCRMDLLARRTPSGLMCPRSGNQACTRSVSPPKWEALQARETWVVARLGSVLTFRAYARPVRFAVLPRGFTWLRLLRTDWGAHYIARFRLYPCP